VVVSFSENILARLKAISGVTNKIISDFSGVYSDEAMTKALDVTEKSNPDKPLAFLRSALKGEWELAVPEKKQTNREWVEERFSRGDTYNGAECYMNDVGVAFERGLQHTGTLKWKTPGFKDQFENMLRKMNINPKGSSK